MQRVRGRSDRAHVGVEARDPLAESGAKAIVTAFERYRQRFLGDERATALMTRARRAPYTLEV